MLTRREYKELYLLHHKKAETGNIESQFKLGKFYEHGDGVVKNYERAAYWYQKAADNGHSMASFNLNWMRLKQEGVQQNEGYLNLSIDCTLSRKKYEPTYLTR